MRAALLALLLALAASAPEALAQPQPPPRYDPRLEPTPQERAIMEAERILKQMLEILRVIPSYDPPVITPEGDIVLRRRPPRKLPDGEPYPPPFPPEPPSRL
ncbi:MAG: hypothetical protein ACT4N4_00090 [Rhodospirillales bacterium]